MNQDRQDMTEDDPRWDRLVENSLSAEEAERLRAEASATPRGRELLRAFEPLDPQAMDRIAAKVLQQIPAAYPPSGTRRVVAAAPRSSRVLPRAMASLAVLAVAAAALGLVVGLERGSPGPVASNPAPDRIVPEYEVEVTGGDVLSGTRAASPQERPTSSKPTLAAAGASLTVVLRPARPAPADVAMIACLVRGGVSRPWGVAWARSEQGSFQTKGVREALFAGEPAGELTLLFAVGTSGALPTCEALSRSGAGLRHTVRIL